MSSTKSNSWQQATLGEAFLLFGQQENVTEVSSMRNIFQASHIIPRVMTAALENLSCSSPQRNAQDPAQGTKPGLFAPGCGLGWLSPCSWGKSREIWIIYYMGMACQDCPKTRAFVCSLRVAMGLCVWHPKSAPQPPPALQGVIRRHRMNPRCWRNMAALRGSHLGQINPKILELVGHRKVSESFFMGRWWHILI